MATKKSESAQRQLFNSAPESNKALAKRASTEIKLKNSQVIFSNTYPDTVLRYGEIEPIKVN